MIKLGIISDAAAIVLGGLFGGKFHKTMTQENLRLLGVSIIIVSLVGFFENMYNVDGNNISSENLIVVLLSYIVGSKVGQWLRLEDRLSNLGKSDNASSNAFVDASLFFGIGGLQICGPIALAINGDSSQLFLKSLIDLPFAVVFGSAYGKIVSLSALPVALIQIITAVSAYFAAPFFSAQLVSQLCAVGFIILFFSGFNLMSASKNKISNINMLPAMFLIILYHIIIGAKEWIL